MTDAQIREWIEDNNFFAATLENLVESARVESMEGNTTVIFNYKGDWYSYDAGNWGLDADSTFAEIRKIDNTPLIVNSYEGEDDE